ncbi:hypothetical protein K490DRAFT_57310 [Saccharata proteae CBS 121410]|uniref:Uncharacterized protein n=1 Tax=Saccharata proteae CBS 121410 TaxID=1314787 RepID=A0A9P4HVS4_9PEZI|nr:hypothetical protein K490DRAFT_57310 [Saccharata proteae CBS 121410]
MATFIVGRSIMLAVDTCNNILTGPVIAPLDNALRDAAAFPTFLPRTLWSAFQTRSSHGLMPLHDNASSVDSIDDELVRHDECISHTVTRPQDEVLCITSGLEPFSFPSYFRTALWAATQMRPATSTTSPNSTASSVDNLIDDISTVREKHEQSENAILEPDSPRDNCATESELDLKPDNAKSPKDNAIVLEATEGEAEVLSGAGFNTPEEDVAFSADTAITHATTGGQEIAPALESECNTSSAEANDDHETDHDPETKSPTESSSSPSSGGESNASSVNVRVGREGSSTTSQSDPSEAPSAKADKSRCEIMTNQYIQNVHDILDNVKSEHEALQENTRKQVAYEQAGRKRAGAKIQRLENELKETKQELTERDRIVNALMFEMDNFRDLEPSGATQRVQDRIASTLDKALTEAFTARDKAIRTSQTSDEQVLSLAKRLKEALDDMKLRGFKKEEMLKFCKQQSDKTKRYAEEDLEMRKKVNRQIVEINRLSVDKENLKHRVHDLEALTHQAFDILIPALDRFHEQDVASLVEGAKQSDSEDFRHLTDLYSDMSARTFNTAAVLEGEQEENNRLSTLVEDQGNKIAELEIKVQTFTSEKEQLESRMFKKDTEAMLEAGRVQVLQESLDRAKIHAAKVPILNVVVNDLRDQLYHEWLGATPIEWSGVIEQARIDMREARAATEKFAETKKKLKKAENEKRAMERSSWHHAGVVEGLTSQIASEHDRRVDLEEELNEVRVAMGLAPIERMIDGDKNVWQADVYKRRAGPPWMYANDPNLKEEWQKVLSVRQGRYYTQQHEENDGEFVAFMVPAENGLYRKVNNAPGTKINDEIETEGSDTMGAEVVRSTTPEGSPVLKLEDLDGDNMAPLSDSESEPEHEGFEDDEDIF